MKTRSVFLGFIAILTLSIASGSVFAGGNEGCTPGYWKQQQHFDSWPVPYTPDSNLRDVFVTAPVELVPDDTFLEALNYNGGAGVAGATNILLRAAVASLLNSVSPDVDFLVSTGHVVDTTITRIETQYRPTLLKRADYFDSLNNNIGGCPLN